MTKMISPLVSILTVTFNQENYISDCIQSVLNQTYKNWELIIVDDGSGDRTCEIIKSYNNDNIKLFELPHKGIEWLSESYRLAVSEAKGDFFAILDGDDWWPENKLEIQVPFFKNKDVDLTFGNVDIYNEKKEFQHTVMLPFFAKGLQNGNKIIKKIIDTSYFPYSVTTMIRKSALEKSGGFIQPPNLPLVDLPTWLNILQNSKCIGIETTIGHYRVHSKSVCRTNSIHIDRAQIAYNEIFLEGNWEKLGFDKSTYKKYYNKVKSYNSYRLGVVEINQGNLYDGFLHLQTAFHLGGTGRKLKIVVRFIQLLAYLVAKKKV